LLQRSGYRTVGISNNTWISGEFGFDRGFDNFHATWKLFQSGVDFGDVAQTETGMLSQARGILRKFRGNPVKNIANLVYGQFFRKRHDDGARKTNQIISENLDSWLEGDPLFLFVNYLEPHLRYDPPAEYAEQFLPNGLGAKEAQSVNQDAWAYISGEVKMSERDFEILRSLYRAELAYLDHRLEELHQMFEDKNAAAETVFLIMGDHGENIGEHGLMDHQYSLNKELLNVPLIIAGENFAQTGAVNRPVYLADVAPTVLDLADVSSPVEFPGLSLRKPSTLPKKRVRFAEYLAPQPEIETLREQYDCTRNVEQYDRRLRALTYDGWKLVRGSDGSESLYDLSKDQPERRDLSEKRAKKAGALTERFEEVVEGLPVIKKEDVSMSQSTEDRLEDLGYLQ
jgi:arylsulfatase A-like enzyme